MIKRNKCNELNCDAFVFRKGKCSKHQPKTSIKKVRAETVEKKKSVSKKREVYFDYHIERCKFSEESFTPINNPSRFNICHILPKSTHESLGEDLRNYVYLTATEHNRFDNLLFKHAFEDIEKEFPNAWETCKSRLRLIIDDCKENTFLVRELRKIL